MYSQPMRRSRLTKQENKRIAKQTILILFATIAFLIIFFWVGIPGLIKLAVVLGNAKATSKFNQEDTLVPLPPQFTFPVEATSSASIIIMGNAEPGTIVSLFQNQNAAVESTADNQGNFSFATIELSDGENTFYATSTDLAGNKSQPSQSQSITLDTKAPSLTIEKPTDGASIFGTLNQLTDIVGTTDPDTIITIGDRQIVVTGDGSFFTKYELQDGDNTLAFKAVDKAGNQTTKEIKVNFSR